MVTDDPVITNPDHYRTLWENEHVRVLGYTDVPGDATTPHDHPNSVMVTLSAFGRRLSAGDRVFDTQLPSVVAGLCASGARRRTDGRATPPARNPFGLPARGVVTPGL
ncbi:cytoplasmic protein [Serinibacter arcticus]|uniref:Uncharacterized protein n=1 Tax=Serinibacter arcticus TaxID=1655435 RepID=A0A4Z1E7D7_9MICO|nr:cytoplasmic protein [Serinibacter arcticus]TGO05491.1 hypothetical protein SERN_1495 [Serinibacter arcticus]